MSACRAAAVLLLPSCWVLVFLIAPPCTGQESDCSCNVPNSRCDEFGVCRCDPGWDGERCERCVPKPGCLHGSCQQPWQCSCEPGWGGRFCDKDLLVCSEQRPCQHGATCLLEDSGDYACLCPEGFHGRNCELKAGPCHRTRSPCQHGGLCEDANGFAAELTCRCLAGFEGPRCETNIDDCQMTPCANGATCLDGVARFSCLCPDGFTGRFCTVNVDDCASRPCLHGGRCLDRAGGFYCVCRPGFAGTTCEARAGVVARDPAAAGGGTQRTDHSDRALKVTVNERSAARLSQLQLVLLLVLGGLTLGALLLTASLVLQGRCRRSCCSTSSPTSQRRQNTQEQEEEEEERQIGFPTSEAAKKKLNTEVL